METNGAIKLYRLEIEDVLGVKSVQMNLDGKSAMVIGPNEAGKTSIIDSILLAIGQHKDGDPRRMGERKGEIYADLGKFEVTRIWKDKGQPKWEVRDKEGNKYGTAKDLFDGFIDSITVKPDQIINLGGTDRARAVSRAAGIDLDEHAEKVQAIKDERLGIGRMKKEADAKMKGIGRPDASVPDKEVSISDLMNELKELKNKQKAREEIEYSLQAADSRIKSAEEEIEELKQKLERANNKLKQFKDDRENIIKKLDDAENYDYQIEAVSEKIQKAESINNLVRNRLKYEEAKADFDKYDEQYDAKSEEIKQIEAGLREKLNNAGLVEGLVVEQDDIYLNNIKFNRLSKFQQLDLAMRIGMHIKSANKEGDSINILCMDVSQYDEENWSKAIEAAKLQGFSVIIEIARRIHRNGNGQLDVPEDIKRVKDVKKFYIEEGMAEELVDEPVAEVVQ